MTHTIELDKDERATIHAALVMFREAYEDQNGAAIREDYPNQFKRKTPLGTEDICTLIERVDKRRGSR